MDTQKMQGLIRKMVYPGATVNSLIVFADKITAMFGQEGLEAYFAALSRMDISKAMTVAPRLSASNRQLAEEWVCRELAHRCKEPDGFSAQVLLAIAACKDASLLQEVAPLLTEQLVSQAMESADATTACSLLRLSLSALAEEPCAWVRQAFCKLLVTKYDERMERALLPILSCLLEQEEVEVLSALVEIAGAEKTYSLFGSELPQELDRLIRSGKDSVGVWELFFAQFFREEHTPEELLEQGLWHVQLFANEEIYDRVCASFYLHAAVRYGVEHPIFAYIEGAAAPETYTHNYILRYKDAIRPLWQDPQALFSFVEKTATCNPFRQQRVQTKRYHLLQTSQDRTGYDRLHGLFEAGLPIERILNVFFSTDLKQRLPLEDLFYLARRQEVLPGLLEALRDVTFTGTIAGQDNRRLYLSPYSYFTAMLHAVPITYKVIEETGNHDNLKGMDLQYTITDFVNSYIHVTICEDAQWLEDTEEDTDKWGIAIEQLRQKKELSRLNAARMERLAITEFTLEDMTEGCDLNQFTALLREHPEELEGYQNLLRLCKWNALFLTPELPLPRRMFGALIRFREATAELFRFLLENPANTEAVLQLYFTSIYRAILPLSMLLTFAPKEQLMEHLPNYIIHCRLLPNTVLCRPTNISCAPVCFMDNTEGISHEEPYGAVIADYVVTDGYLSRITLQPYQMGPADVDERGALFGYLASSMYIGQHRAQRIATMISAAQCRYRELKFNMRCMEDAVWLRRSNAQEMRNLICILGEANPYAFGVSYAADRIYLNRRKWRDNVPDLAISVVLNAKSIEDIRDFYLHTHVKYHMQLPELAALISERRADLAEQIPDMFAETPLRAIVGAQGELWMPWVAQDTVRVSREYAGQVLRCRLRFEKDGTVTADVLQAEQSPEFSDILGICLLSGYQPDPQMEAQAELLKPQQTQPELTNAEAAEIEYGALINRLRKMLHQEDFSHEEFAQGIHNLIVRYEDITAAQLEKTITTLTRKWLHQKPDREKIPRLMQWLCMCFAQKHNDETLRYALAQQLYQYLGAETAQAFEVQLQRKQATADQEIRSFQDQPFPVVCKYLQGLLEGTTFASVSLLRHIVKMIHTHCEQVSAAEMETAVAELIRQWLQMYSLDDGTINELLTIHTGFVYAYHSGSLGLQIIHLVYQYSSEINGDKVERGICKITYQNLSTHPELAQMLPPFARRMERLQSWLQDPAYPAGDVVKRLGRLVRQYCSIIPEEEMKAAILPLTEQLQKENFYYPHTGQMAGNLQAAFESGYGSSEIGKLLFRQTCRIMEKKISSAVLLSQPVEALMFVGWINRLLQHYNRYVSCSEMETEILTQTQRWIVDTEDEIAVVKSLVNIHKHFVATYGSEDLLAAFCQVCQQHLSQGAVDTLKASRAGKASPTEALEISLDMRKEQIAKRLEEADFSQRTFADKIHGLIRRYACTEMPQEIVRAVTELTAPWLRMKFPESEVRFYLCGIHNYFVKYCKSDCLAEPLCRQLAEHYGEDVAQAFDQQLQERMEKFNRAEDVAQS